MRKVTVSVVAAVVVAVVIAGAGAAVVSLSPPDPPPAATGPVARSFDYGSEPSQDLDAYLPADLAAAAPGTAALPIVVLVHGGGWTRGDKATMARPARAAVQAGYVAVAVNYRLAPGVSPWPTQRRDLRRALGWVRDNAAVLQADPARMFVLGSSAGGEISLGTLTRGSGSKLARGVVALSPPADLALVASNTADDPNARALARTVTKNLPNCVDGTPVLPPPATAPPAPAPAEVVTELATTTCDALYARRSAVSQLDAEDPAVLLLVSRAEWVDPLSSYRFHAAADRLGLDTTLLRYEGDRHGMSYLDDAWPQIWAWIEERAGPVSTR